MSNHIRARLTSTAKPSVSDRNMCMCARASDLRWRTPRDLFWLGWWLLTRTEVTLLFTERCPVRRWVPVRMLQSCKHSHRVTGVYWTEADYVKEGTRLRAATVFCHLNFPMESLLLMICSVFGPIFHLIFPNKKVWKWKVFVHRQQQIVLNDGMLLMYLDPVCVRMKLKGHFTRGRCKVHLQIEVDWVKQK